MLAFWVYLICQIKSNIFNAWVKDIDKQGVQGTKKKQEFHV